MPPTGVWLILWWKHNMKKFLPLTKMLWLSRGDELKRRYWPDLIFHTWIWKRLIVLHPTAYFGMDLNLILIVVITCIPTRIAPESKRICFTNGWLVILDRWWKKWSCHWFGVQLVNNYTLKRICITIPIWFGVIYVTHTTCWFAFVDFF